MSTRACISLGSNLGARQAHLDRAVAALAATSGLEVCAVSRYRETSPVGGPRGQGAFLNAAATLETAFEPKALLDVLNAIEADAGRVRVVRWGERTLDLDLLLYGDRVIDTPRLTVPHPMICFRRFVLAPLGEVAATATEPRSGRTVADLLANLDRRPSHVALHGNEAPFKAGVFEGLVRELSSSEGWLVTDHCPIPKPDCLAPCRESDADGPTFTVALGRERWPQTGPVPTYRPRSSTIDATVSEILDVCAATRIG